MKTTLMDIIVNTRDKSGQTPLMAAVLQGNLEVALFLLSRGADTGAVDNRGNTVLHYAILSGRLVRALWQPAGLHRIMQAKNTDGLTAFQLGLAYEVLRTFWP